MPYHSTNHYMTSRQIPLWFTMMFTFVLTAAQSTSLTDEQLVMLTETRQNYTFQDGAAAPIPGFPNLPSATIDPSKYPALDKVPPVDSDTVKQWISKIDMSKSPNSSVNGLNGCTNTTFNAGSISKSGSNGNCWWTCSGCTRDTDVTSCPNKGTWGASFDDGPSPYTSSLLQYLDQNKLKATFFVVGSRAISYPKVLQAEYMSSHQICLHTWSHTSLTTLTNEQIIAEFAWSMKAIKDIIGVTPNCARPPYGDVDDRVRYIMKSMGLSVIIWTSVNGVSFDTEDWKVEAGMEKPRDSVKQFSNILSLQSNLQTGFIVLAHDLFQKTIALSINAFLPQALKTQGIQVQSIGNCLGIQPSQSFYEGSILNKNGSSQASANNKSSQSMAKNSPSNHLVIPDIFWVSAISALLWAIV